MPHKKRSNALFAAIIYTGSSSRRTFVQNQQTMLKMLFWGFIGYLVYRYFQMKGKIKQGHHSDFAKRQQHQPPQQGPTAEKMHNDGEFIDYEEIK